MNRTLFPVTSARRSGRTRLESSLLVAAAAQNFTAEDDARLREQLKYYAPSTYYAAYQFRSTGDVGRVRAIVRGVIEREAAPALRAKLWEADEGLRLFEDLAIDSLALMEILVLVEDVLQIEVTADEIGRLTTLGEVEHLLEGKVRRLAEPVPPPGNPRARVPQRADAA